MARLGAEHAARSMIRDKPRHSLQRLVGLRGLSFPIVLICRGLNKLLKTQNHSFYEP